jgi:hypothetical protein
VRVVGYAYPWDYEGDPGAAERSRETGVDAVALAASYHATRAASPLHPTRRLLDVAESACYVPVRDGAWRGHRLAPRRPSWTNDGDLFATAARQLVDVGLEVEAWIVLTHHDQFGQRHPDLVVRNAFGDRYDYALCPSADDVREYCVTLVREIARDPSIGGVVLEACGPMGLEHATLHDKSEFACWSPTAQRLLAICFCARCCRALADLGIDVDRLRHLVREGVDGTFESVEEALGEELAEPVATYRGDLAASLRREIAQGLRATPRDLAVTVHASGDRWATGAFSAPGESSTLADVDTVVANCWDGDRARHELGSLSQLLRGRCALGAYLRLDRGWQDGTIDATLARYARSGMTELHLYHLGLVSQPGLDLARRLARAGRSLAAPDGRGPR